VSSRLRSRALLAAGALGVLGVAGCGGSGSTRGADALVFVSTRGGPYELYAAKGDGSDQHRLTKDRGDASTKAGLRYQIDPAWSPDGKRIAFSSSRDGQFHIFIVDASGKTTKRLTAGKNDDTHPSWSPDGTRIAFTRGAPDRIEVMNADGTGLHRVTSGLAEEADPAWSPNGRWIAFDLRTPGTAIEEIWIEHPDGSASHSLTKLHAVSTSPTWSPDSRRIAFSSNARGGRYNLYSIGVGGTGLQLESSAPSDEFEPAWSPDGKSIAFSRDGAIVVAPVGAGTESIITDPKNNDSYPAWNPVQAVKAKGY
jgi:TolB protein